MHSYSSNSVTAYKGTHYFYKTKKNYKKKQLPVFAYGQLLQNSLTITNSFYKN